MSVEKAKIRKSRREDLREIMHIYAYAREFMASTGNPDQWGKNKWPPQEIVEKDIEAGKSYVLTDEERILAVFFYDFGERIDPCYDVIEKGEWIEETPYGVVHRIAAAPYAKGAGQKCISWAYEQCGHLRIDTHPDNKVMRHVLEKLGFSQRGIIYVKQDPDPRYAFEKVREYPQ